MSYSYKDSICLITGAAQGVGWALACALANKGAQVYLCDISEKYLTQAKSELQNSHLKDRIYLSDQDVTNFQSTKKWISGIYQKTNKIDIVINNANYICWKDIADMSVADVKKTMHVDYIGMIHVIHVILPYMRRHQSGCIVNIGSSAGKVFSRGMPAAYAAAKAAIDAYTQILQKELQSSAIHAILVRPGTIAGTHFFKCDPTASKRLPLLADLVPYLTPTNVAEKILKGIEKNKMIINIPSYLKFFYFINDYAPNLLNLLLKGHSKRDYSDV